MNTCRGLTIKIDKGYPTAACFNCETGKLLPGKYGYYCPTCDTYLPTGDAAQTVESYFAALGFDDIAAGEHRQVLDEMRAETIRTAKAIDYTNLAADIDYTYLAKLAFDYVKARTEHATREAEHDAYQIITGADAYPKVYDLWIKLADRIAQGEQIETAAAVEYLQGE